ncbi:MAG TPA: YicC/YloC family endoribonuclease [Gallionella sp.]|nr:YicC/YloC family endoribonuclease [Gallionella sp.]
MILSMTGYATASAELENGSLTLELRAVNHRYLDIQLRMPDELRCFENGLREAITAQLQRGKVECRINYAARGTQSGATLNHDLLGQLATWNKAVQDALPGVRSLSVADVLRWNGVLETPSASADELHAALLDLMQTALMEFSASRAREGEKLKDFLLQRVEKIESLRNSVMPHVPAAIAAYEQKLINRLREAMQNATAQESGTTGIPGHYVWDERVRQEITLFASKIDVDEELSRLASHLTEMRRILTQGGAVGKRLDFLMQELNREANTLGSKSVDAEVSRSAMEMKILIEQMREQIQNLE